MRDSFFFIFCIIIPELAHGNNSMTVRGIVMFFKRKDQPKDNTDQSAQNQADIPAAKDAFLAEMKGRFSNSADFIIKELSPELSLLYIETLIETTMLNENIIGALCEPVRSLDQALEQIDSGSKNKLDSLDKTIDALLEGSAIIHFDGIPSVLSANIKTTVDRSLNKPENESQVLGPQLAFIESLNTNLSLIRRYLVNPALKVETFQLGVRTRSKVSLLFLEGIADDGMIATVRQRINDIQIDGILDSSILLQLIEDNTLSIFPQMVLTERPDRTCSLLLEGKLAILTEGSSQAIICPVNFVEFFKSMEDQNVRWHIATFLRLLRLFAMQISIFFTAIYVASLTFHYEIIPQPLLVPLSESRSKVPFPPIFEALLLEFTIELLREAGARLPTKVGQTMGIVGGIVVGTAAVQAGFTSNILIIIIALSALASFTTPSYMMGNVIRILRFPLIFLAGFWGFYGLSLGFAFIVIHLVRQSSLGSPYLAPFYPPRFSYWLDSIIRMPLPFTNTRPYQSRPKDMVRYPRDPDQNE